MIVPQKQCAMPAEVIDILVPIDVPFPRSGCALHVNSIRIDMPRIVRDPTRQQSRRLLRQRAGTQRARLIGRDNAGIGAVHACSLPEPSVFAEYERREREGEGKRNV